MMPDFAIRDSLNRGEFRGVQESGVDIAWLAPSGSCIGAANLETTFATGIPPARDRLAAAGRTGRARCRCG